MFAHTQAYNSIQVFQFITTSMERFYERRLFGIAHCYPGHIKIAKHFLCLGWKAIDATKIQQTEIDMEFLVPSQENANTFYTVNIELSTCTCYIGSSEAPCKHQGAVAARYNIGLLNFLHSLTPDDRAHFAYIAHGLMANDPSFYASLHTHANNQHEYYKCNNSISPVGNKSHELEEFNVNQTQELKELNVNQTQEAEEFNTVSENDPDFFKSFIESIKYDYENGGSQLQLALEKFAERYNVAKSKSTTALTSFLYNINRNADPLTRIKSGAKIHVQVESVKRRKTNKENVDPQVIPTRKV